jgi:type IV secretion system protein TrbL
MGNTGVIDNFLGVFTSYIDSGFGLLGGEVAFIATTLIVIDVTLAALFWAWGADDDIIARLVKKTLFVGVFAYIIGNWNNLARIVFESFAGLGLMASGTGFSVTDLMRPGRVAQTGLDAGRPLLDSISDLMGWIAFFENFIQIACLLFAWALVVLAFFILAIQLFVTLLEFKLTTLAGFVLIPFGLFGKTAFMAEKVLGNVVSSGIKVLVLAVIVGIGSSLFAEFQVQPAEPSIDHSVVVMLASLTLLALGIFGPGIATGLVSGGPQLGAGAMAGAALGAAGAAVAVGAAATGVGVAVAAGARMAPAAAKLAGSGARAASGAASSAKSAFQAGSVSAGGGLKGAAAGVGNVAKTGAQAAGQKVAQGARSIRERAAAAFGADTPAASGSAPSGDAPSTAPQEQPAWAKRLHRRQQLTHAATTAAHTLRGGDGGGSGQGPSLRNPDE